MSNIVLNPWAFRRIVSISILYATHVNIFNFDLIPQSHDHKTLSTKQSLTKLSAIIHAKTYTISVMSLKAPLHLRSQTSSINALLRVL